MSRPSRYRSMPRALSLEDIQPIDIVRLSHRIKVCKKTGAWLGQGSPDPAGYIHFRLANGRATRLHRVAYAAFVGPLEDGQVVHHTKHDLPKNDCNPAHLVACSNVENVDERNARRTLYRCPNCAGGLVWQNSTVNVWVCLHCDRKFKDSRKLVLAAECPDEAEDEEIPI